MTGSFAATRSTWLTKKTLAQAQESQEKRNQLLAPQPVESSRQSEQLAGRLPLAAIEGKRLAQTTLGLASS